MGFRDEIRLDDFIASSPELTDVLGGTNVGFSFDGGYAVSFMPPPKVDEDYLIFEKPSRYGSGVETRSTSTDLVSWPLVCWDVNGYYHALGVGFRATKRQLMDGYRRVGGPDDDRLTYYFQQLLDSDVRRLYDAAPLGSVFFDRYVEEEVRRRAHQMSVRMRERGLNISPEDVLEQMGFMRVAEEEIPQEDGELDTDIAEPQNEDTTSTPVSEPAEKPWPYAYYLWNVKAKDSRDHDIEHMSRWQDLVAQGCIDQGIKTAFAVGLMGKQKTGSRVATMSVEGVTVIFIAQDAVNEMDELVPSALNRLNTRD